jgi:hypothetical protein
MLAAMTMILREHADVHVDKLSGHGSPWPETVTFYRINGPLAALLSRGNTLLKAIIELVH